MSLVASTYIRSTNGSSSVTSPSIDTTSATVMIAIMTRESVGEPGLSDFYSNSWVPLTARTQGIRTLRPFVCIGGVVGAGHTFTIGGLTNSFPSLTILAFDTYNQVDFETGTVQGSGGTIQAGSITPSNAVSLVVAAMQNVGIANSMSIDSGFTLEFNLPESFVADAVGCAWKEKVASSAENPTWTFTSSAAQAVLISLIVGVPPPEEARVTQQVLEFLTGPPLEESSFVDGVISHPEWWIEHYLTTTSRAYSQVTLPDDKNYYLGCKFGLVTEWDRVTRGLSDWQGQLEHAAYGATYTDVNRYFRGLLADDGDDRYLTNRPFIFRGCDDPDRRIEGVPRLAMNGFISDYSPMPGFKFGIHGSDFIYRHLSRSRKSQLRWQPLVGVNEFDPNTTPQDVLNRPAPIIYGQLSDKNQATRTPPDNVTGYLPDPVTLAATVHGSPANPVTRRYYITGMNGKYGNAGLQKWTDHRGETLPGDGGSGAFLDVTGCPDDQELRDQVNGGVANTWVELTCSCPDATAVRVYRGKDDGSGIEALGYADDLGSGSFSFLDGKSSGSGSPVAWGGITSKPPLKNNTYVTLSVGVTVTTDLGSGDYAPMYTGIRLCPDSVYRSEFLVAAHACKGNFSLYVGGVRVPDSDWTDKFWVPNSTEWNLIWPHTHYVEVNGFRYSIIYVDRGTAIALGLVSNDELSLGSTALTVNVDGIETVGDGSGDLIDNLVLMAQHFAENAVAANRPFNAQDWVGDAPLFFSAIPDLPYIDRVTFAAVSVIDDFVGGFGGVIGYRGEEIGELDVMARFCLSGDFQIGVSRTGQLIASREPTSVPSDIQSFTDVINLVSGTMTLVDQVTAKFFNIQPYRWGKDYSGRTFGGPAVVSNTLRVVLPDSGGWKSTAAGEKELTDPDSITNYDQEIATSSLDLHFVRESVTAAPIIQRRLDRYKNPLRVLQFRVPLSGTNIDLGVVFTITANDGISTTGATGYEGRAFRCVRHELDPNTNSVLVEAYDLQRVIDAAA